MAEWIRLLLEAAVAVAMGYLAMAFRAFRAEMVLEIERAVDKLATEIKKQYVTQEVCALRHQLVDEREKR